MEKFYIFIEDESIKYFFKIVFTSIFTIYLNYKMLAISEENIKEKIKTMVPIFFIDFISILLNHIVNSTIAIIFVNVFIAILFSRRINRNIGFSLMITLVSFCINYILYVLAIIANFIIFKIFNINGQYINLLCILIFYCIVVIKFGNMKKLKNGISFFRKNEHNELLGILILNIAIILFLLFMILSNANTSMETMKSVFIYLIIFSIIMFITIQKSLQLYYKQKLQEREVEEIKEELKNKDKEIEELEKENLKLNKKNHSIAHKQKSLEYQIEQITANNQMTNKNQVKDEIKNLSKEMQNETVSIELTKTGINEIDSMLKYMQSECIKNKIEFELQINGNIHHMINTYIGKEDLEILIADLIKNAIIAIQHSENSNKSILVRLGLIDGFYSLYVYDSGIEFEIDTLKNIGIKPSTTHAKEGGTGMGLINTFDAVRKYKASFIINELGKPVENNYTKVIKIIFDNNNKYEVMSYRKVNFRDSP